MNIQSMLTKFKYTHHDDLQNISKLASVVLSSLDWRKIKNKLSTEPKELPSNALRWYSVTVNDNKHIYESNTEHPNEIFDSLSLNNAEYFHVDLTHQAIHELTHLKNNTSVLPGITYVGVHFLGPNTVIQKHTDENTYNVLFHIKVSPECFLEIVDTKFNFYPEQIFLFDGEMQHGATNCSNEDWIIFVLRIDKRYFVNT